MCRPFHRRIICTRNFARRAIATVLLLAALVSVHKPLLGGVYDVTSIRNVTGTPPPDTDNISQTGVTAREIDETWAVWIATGNGSDVTGVSSAVCGRNPDYSWQSSFITEIVYGLSITVVPFIPITVLNVAILRALVTRDRLAAAGTTVAEVSSSGAGSSRPRYRTVEKKVRREFTIILLVICASVLCLSLPYFVVWCRQYLQSRLVSPPLSLSLSHAHTRWTHRNAYLAILLMVHLQRLVRRHALIAISPIGIDQ